jgi:hypothetical protein
MVRTIVLDGMCFVENGGIMYAQTNVFYCPTHPFFSVVYKLIYDLIERIDADWFSIIRGFDNRYRIYVFKRSDFTFNELLKYKAFIDQFKSI